MIIADIPVQPVEPCYAAAVEHIREFMVADGIPVVPLAGVWQVTATGRNDSSFSFATAGREASAAMVDANKQWIADYYGIAPGWHMLTSYGAMRGACAAIRRVSAPRPSRSYYAAIPGFGAAFENDLVYINVIFHEYAHQFTRDEGLTEAFANDMTLRYAKATVKFRFSYKRWYQQSLRLPPPYGPGVGHVRAKAQALTGTKSWSVPNQQLRRHWLSLGGVE